MLDKLLRYFGCFDSNGLKHSSEHLAEMRTKIIHLPLSEMAKYADKTCVRNIKDIEFQKEQFKDINVKDTSIYPNLNTTSIGNMAYLGKYSPSMTIRRKARTLLSEYKFWLKSFQ